MGKGDIKTKKGKVAKGSFGVRRPRKHTPAYVASSKPKVKVAAKPASKAPAKKAPVKKED